MTKEKAETLVWCYFNIGRIEDEYEDLPDAKKILTKQGNPKKKPTRSDMEEALIKNYTTED